VADLADAQLGIFEHIVQQTRGDYAVVGAVLREDCTYGDRVTDCRRSGDAELSLMSTFSGAKRATDERDGGEADI
jgi:hypothetical protein